MSPIDWECLVCSYIWSAPSGRVAPKDILTAKGCPKCRGVLPWTDARADQFLLDENIPIRRIGHITRAYISNEWECLKCFGRWNTRPNHILANEKDRSGCPVCSRTDYLPKEKVIEKLQLQNWEFHPNETYIQNVDSTSSRKAIQCKKCNFGNDGKYKPILDSKFRTSCADCKGRARWTQKKFSKALDLVDLISHPDDPWADGVDTSVSHKKLICKKCKYGQDGSWTPVVASIGIGTGCPFCNVSRNQKTVYKILSNFDPSFQWEVKLRDVNSIFKPHYKFDIYSFELNIAVEYDGEGHFQPVNFRGVSDERAVVLFQRTQKCDKYKNAMCNEHNIKLIRIDGRKYKNNNIKDYVYNVVIPEIQEFVNQRNHIAA
jgi:hypothetical protein